jgi:DNA repair protein RecN (Recombination protein N)
MLALRGILARKSGAAVMIFDEVDAGIGGAIAEVVGKKLKELSLRNQVLCVTHLPQIARFAEKHYRVWKQMEKNRTVARIKALSTEERIEELARMLGGTKITEKTRAYAKEMLEENQ